MAQSDIMRENFLQAIVDLVPPKVEWGQIRDCRQMDGEPAIELKVRLFQLLQRNGSIDPSMENVRALVVSTLAENLLSPVREELKRVVLTWKSSTTDQITEAAIQKNLYSKGKQAKAKWMALQIDDLTKKTILAASQAPNQTNFKVLNSLLINLN